MTMTEDRDKWKTCNVFIALKLLTTKLGETILYLKLCYSVTQCQSHVSQLYGVLCVSYRYAGRHHVRVSNSLHLNTVTLAYLFTQVVTVKQDLNVQNVALYFRQFDYYRLLTNYVSISCI